MGGNTKQVPTSSTTTAQIPDFLKPLLTQAAQTSGRSLGDLESTVRDIVSSMPATAGDLSSQAVTGILDYVGGNDQYRNLALKKLSGIAGGANGRELAKQYNALGPAEDEYTQPDFQQQQVNPTANSTFEDLMRRFDPNSAGVQASADASIRAAQPYVFSGFGKTGGVGAIKSGLAQVAMQQAASDAFARLYDSAEQRRLGAATGQSTAEAQKAQAAAMEAAALAAQRANRIQEKALTAGLMEQERRNQMLAASGLSGVGQENIGLLMDASNIPLNAQSTLFNSAQSAIPANVIGQSTVGQDTYFRNRASGGLGGALTGAQIGSVVPGLGTGIGAIAGGLLGAFG